MKSFVMLILIFLSTMSFSQSNRQRLEDIDDRLEMMQAEQEYKDAQRRIEQQNRGSGETPLQKYIKNRFTKIFTNANVSIYIHDKTLSNHGTNDNQNIFYVFLFEFQKPNYTNNGKPYFIVEGSGTVVCKKSFVLINDYIFQDKNLNAFEQSGRQSFKTKDKLEEEIQKYLCR